MIGFNDTVQPATRPRQLGNALLNKAATIERRAARALGEYARDPASFSSDFTRQDAAVLNIQRACEADWIWASI